MSSDLLLVDAGTALLLEQYSHLTACIVVHSDFLFYFTNVILIVFKRKKKRCVICELCSFSCSSIWTADGKSTSSSALLYQMTTVNDILSQNYITFRLNRSRKHPLERKSGIHDYWHTWFRYDVTEYILKHWCQGTLGAITCLLFHNSWF